MSDDLLIRIKTWIEQVSDAQVKKTQQEIQSKFDSIKLKTDIDTAVIDRYNEKFVELADGTNYISQRTAEWTESIGRTVQATEILDKKSQNVLKTIIDTNINYKQQQKLIDDFQKKNINAIDFMIKKREIEGRQFSKLLQEQMKMNVLTEREAERKANIYAKLNEQLIKLQQNAITTNNVLKNFGGTEHHKKADELTASLQKLNINQNMTQKEMQETIAQARMMSNELNNVSKTAKAAGMNSMTLGKMISVAFEKFYIWMGVTSTFYGSIRIIREAAREVIELDTAITELNKVLEVSAKELVDYTEKAYKIGETLARTGKDVIRATAEFARAGFNLEESSLMSSQALLLTNVAEGLEDTADAAGYLIAILKGYNLTAKDTVHVVDLLNEVSNNYAVSTLKLAEGLQRTSGTLSQTGTTVEQLAGILTGGYEVLRNMEKVSTGLITISTRLRGVTETGEEIDGLMPKLQDKFERFAGIKIQTVNGELRSTYDILKDLSEVWDQLSDEEKSELGFLASGLRQSPVLNAIMLNWENVEKAAQTALNSTNSAIKENEKYMDSLEGRINLLNSALSKLAYDTIDSKLFKSLIGLATVIVKVIDKVGVLTVAFTVLFSVLQLKGITTIAIGFFDTLSLSIAGLITRLGVAETAALNFSMALSTILPVIAIVGGIYAFTKAMDYLNTSMSEFAEQVNRNYDEIQQNINNIETLKEEYISLANQVELSREQKLRLIDIERRLKTRYRETAGAIDFQNKSLEENIKLFDEAAKEEAERFLILNKKAYEAALRMRDQAYILEGQQVTIQYYENIEKAIERTKKLLEEPDISDSTYKARSDILKKLYEDYDNMIDIIDKYEGYERLLAESARNASDSMDQASKSAQQYAQVVENASNIFDEALSSYNILSDAKKELEEYGNLSLETMMEVAKNFEDLIIPMFENEANLRELLAQKMVDLEAEAQEQALNIYREAIIQKLDSDEEFYNLRIRGIIEMYREIFKSYQIDVDNFKTVANAKDAIDKALVSVVGERWVNLYGATEDGIKQMIGVLESQVQQAYSMGSSQMAHAYQQQINALRQLLGAVGSISSSMSDFVSSIDLGSISLGGLSDVAKSARSALSDPYEDWLKTAESVANKVINVIKRAYQKQKKIALDAIEKEQEALDKSHKKRIKQLEDQYSAFEKIINQRIRSIDDQADEDDYQRELIKLLEERDQILRDITIFERDDSYEAREKVFELRKNLTEKEEQIEQLQSKRTKDLRKQGLQDQLNNFKSEIDRHKELQETLYQQEKDRLDRIKEETEYYWDEMLNNERYFAELREDILNGNIDAIEDRLGEFIDYFKEINKDAAKEMKISYQEILNIIDEAIEAQKQLRDLGSAPPKSRGGSSGGSSGSGGSSSSGSGSGSGSSPPPSYQYNSASSAYNKGFNDAYYERGRNTSGVNPAYISNYNSGYQYGIKERKMTPKHHGGIAGETKHEGGISGDGKSQYHSGYTPIPGGVKNPISKQINDIFQKKNQAETFATLLKGEVVVHPITGIKNFRSNVLDFLSQLQPQLQSVGNTGSGDMINNFKFEFVGNYTKNDANEISNIVFEKIWRNLKRQGKLIIK